MANEKIKLMAKANQLGIDGYRQMSEDDLRTAIAKAEKGAKTSAKGKTTATKGKTTATAAKGKSTPAKGKTVAAKKTATAKTTAKGKSTAKASPAKSTAQKSTPKGKAAQGAQAKRAPARGARKVAQGAARLDNKAIDWKAESNVGKTGKRKDVMDALRKFKGDKAKVFDLLAPKAKTFYKGKTKHEAERLLVWLIGRVAFDFAMNTGQHTPGSRAEYGTSEAAQDIRRRDQRDAARKAEAKADRAARRGGAGTTRAKTTTAKGKGKTVAKGKGK